MKKIILFYILLCLSLTLKGQKELSSTKGLIKKMHKTYKGKWFNDYTFIQKTIRFKADGTVRDSSTWYEAINYPKNFRIDFGDPALGNANLCRNDSVYSFRDGQLQRASLNPQQFLLMKGGLYHYSKKETIQALIDYGYDVNQFRTDTFKGRKVYVLGAPKGDENSFQFWIDAEHFFLVRRISTTQRGQVMDVHYEDHIAIGGGWVEQTVKFYMDGRYAQIEYYQNIDTSPNLPASLFDPKRFGASHWLEK